MTKGLHSGLFSNLDSIDSVDASDARPLAVEKGHDILRCVPRAELGPSVGMPLWDPDRFREFSLF